MFKPLARLVLVVIAPLALAAATLALGTVHAQDVRPRERRAVRDVPQAQRDNGRVDPRREERQRDARVREVPTSARSERRALPDTRARKR